MKLVKVAFLGFGNIGSSVYRVLQEHAQLYAHRDQVRFEVTRALVRDAARPRGDVPQALFTTRFADILEDTSIELVCEFMGGVEPAADYMQQLLAAGKNVVSANKEAIAHRWSQLDAACARSGAGLYYEASVCAGVPILKAIRESLQANAITDVLGIINGTTNYMLSAMAQEGLSYEQALARAQQLGLAEPDPTYDVEGFDAASKLSILTSLAFHAKVRVENVQREGITAVTAEDIAAGHKLGYTLKLLAIGKKRGIRVQARVHPAFVPFTHPLASVQDSFNAVFIKGYPVGELMFYGRGAGGNATASAIVSDMLSAATATCHRAATFDNDVDDSAHMMEDWQSRFYMRTLVSDKPGVLAEIAGVLAGNNVSIASCLQTDKDGDGQATLIIVTHPTSERGMLRAVDQMRQLSCVAQVSSLIHVEK